MVALMLWSKSTTVSFGHSKSYETFLDLWKNADPDIPIYQQAKAEYAKLQK